MGMVAFKRQSRLADIEERKQAVRSASSSGGADAKAQRLAMESKAIQRKMAKDNAGFKRAFTSSGGAKRSVQPPTKGFSSQKAGAALGLAQTAMGGNSGGQTSTAGGALSGAMGGAQAGMALGPMGALVGGGIGAITGGLAAKAEAKKQRAEIEASLHETQGRIEEDKADRLNRALSGLQSQFGASLNF